MSVSQLVAIAVMIIAATAGSGGNLALLDERSVADDVDDVLLSIQLQPSGDADWEIAYRTRLDSDDRRDAFETLRASIEEDPATYLDPVESQLDASVAAATTMTGREMAIVDLAVAAEVRHIPREYGVVTFTFTWEGFAEAEEGRLIAGEVLTGMFLDEDTALRIGWPADHELVDVGPSPDETRDTVVVWNGPIDFAPGEPYLVVSAPDHPLAAAAPGWVAFVAGVIVVAVVGAAWVALGRPWPGWRDGDDHASPSGDHRSNEERVLALLEANRGRIKQQEILEAYGWSPSKTSEVVTAMHENGQIERFRLGRENVISLPEDRRE